MSIAPLPTPLQHLGGRRFSFYPPIRNVGPNEWLYRSATWSECMVANAKTGEELWVPRIFLGEVTRVDEPLMVVGLNRELEFREGVIVPRQRKVIQFPVEVPMAVNDSGSAPRPHQLAPVINIRLETPPETRAWKWMGVAAVLGAVALSIVTNVAHQSQLHQRGDVYRGYRSFLQLGPGDDYVSAVRKLGAPSVEHSREWQGRVVRALVYPARRYSIVLAGTTSQTAHYAGTIDNQGHILDAVRAFDGSGSEPILRAASGM
jgi:hypothetical protein